MKRALNLVFLILCVLCWVNGKGEGNVFTSTNKIVRDGVCGDNLTWTLAVGVLSITGTGEMFDWDSIRNHAPWYESRNGIYEVKIEEGVTSIGSFAFFECSSLSRATVPTSVSTIKDHAFYKCSLLGEFSVSANVEFIGRAAFAFCTTLTSIGVEQGNTHFREKDGVLFDYQHTKILQYPAGITRTSYTIPNSVKTVGDCAFSGSQHIENIIIPSSVESLENSAFSNCVALDNVVVPSSVKTLEGGIFSYCTGLRSVSLPSSLTKITDGMFCGCTSLESITIPYGVTTICAGSFASCTNLNQVSIPNSVSSIEGGAFQSCTNLNHVTIPESVTSIVSSAFGNCCSLSSVFYQGTEPISTTVFPSCNVNNVCVSPGYKPAQFGSLDVTSDSELCQTFQELFDICSAPVYNDDHFVLEGRMNTTEWVSQSTGCIERACVKESGFVWWSICNNTDKNRVLCLSDSCVREDELDKYPYVEYVLDEPVKADELNTTEIIEAACVIGSVCKDLEIGYKIDANGDVFTVIMFVGDEESAQVLVSALDSIRKGENCTAGIFCNSKEIRIVLRSQSLSGATSINEMACALVLISVMINILFTQHF